MMQNRNHNIMQSIIRTLLLLLLVVGGGEMWGQHPFTLTTATDVTNGTETLYWIESAGADGFYAIPHTNNSNVSTTNMPNLKALWYFMDAGSESNTQYYYIVNHNTGYYLKLDGTIGSDNTIKIASFGSGGDAYKFSIGGSEGEWILYPKSGNGNYWVNKKSSNVPYDKYLKSSNYGGSPDANSMWNFVARNSVTWAHPFTNSTNSEKYYYKIHNATVNGAEYYMSTDDDTDPYATISNVDNDKCIWHFVEATSDNSISNFKYYYIVNSVTGKYLKFTGTANGNVQTNSLRLYEHTGSETGNTEDRFQFMMLNAKGDTYSAYSIMPKLEINYYYNKSASLSPGDANGNTYSGNNAITLSNDMKIGIYNDRGQNNNYAHWTFESIDACEDPEFGFNSATEKGTLSSSTTGASLYYTTATGTGVPATPTTTTGTLYDPDEGISVSENAITTIKAVAYKEGLFRSEVVTKTIIYMPTITLSGGPYTYDGNAKTPSISSVMVGETPVSASDYDISYENNTNAGTATVTIREKTGNATIIYGTTTFTIAKASITPTVSITGWTYGMPNDPSVSGNTGNGTVTYKYKVKGAGDDTYSNEKPENAGTYLVKAIIAESTNYNGATTEPVEFTISKATFNPTVSITGWAYGGSANSPSVSGIPGGVTVTYKYKVQGANDNTYSTDVPTNVGNYTVQATIAETTNYNAASATTNFSISKADINPTVSITGWTYGGTANTPSVDVNPGSGAVTYKYKVQGADDGTYSSTVPTNAGNYTVQATIAETGNYNGKTVTADFTIAKADFNPAVTITGWTYGGTANTPSVDVNPGSGAVTYQYKVQGANDNTYATEIPTNAGNYTVRASIAATTNYNAASATTDFTISKASSSATVSIDGWIYGETAATPSVTGNTGNGAVTYTYKVKGADDNTYSVTVPTNAGEYTVKASIAATDNYIASSATADFIISKASLLSATVSIDDWIYGETAATPSVTGNTENGTVTYSYKVKDADNGTYSSTVPTNAGTYTVKASIATTANYLASEATTDFIISPKSIGDGNRAADGITIELTSTGDLSAVTDGSTPLTEDVDYICVKEADGADMMVVVTGIGNYTGVAKGIYANPVFKDPDGNGVAAAVYQAKRDMAIPSDITPYVVKKVNPTIGTLTITPLTYIPEGVPVLLLSPTESDGFTAAPKDEQTQDISDAVRNSNQLKVAPEGGVVVKDTEAYMFYKGEFVLTREGTIKKDNFYIYNPNYKAGTSGGSAPSRGTLQFVIEEEDVTGIDDSQFIIHNSQWNDGWYTLDGRRLSGKPAQKGLYIKNGKIIDVRH